MSGGDSHCVFSVEIRVEGDQKATFFLNGEKVLEVWQMEKKEGRAYVPLSAGRIGLQAEWAEIFYRNIRVKQLRP